MLMFSSVSTPEEGCLLACLWLFDVQIRDAAVSDLPTGSTVKIGIPERGTYRGLASVNNLNLLPNEGEREGPVETSRMPQQHSAQQVFVMHNKCAAGHSWTRPSMQDSVLRWRLSGVLSSSCLSPSPTLHLLWYEFAVKEVISVRTERLDDVIGNQDVLLLKVRPCNVPAATTDTHGPTCP
jgi:hypothetical protein